MLDALIGLIILLILVTWIVKHRKSFLIVVGTVAILATIAGLAALYLKLREDRQAASTARTRADSLSALQRIFDSLAFHPGSYSDAGWRRWEMIDSTSDYLLYAVRYGGENVGIRVVFHEWRFAQPIEQWREQRRYKSIEYFVEVICSSEQIQITSAAFYADERPAKLWNPYPGRLYDVQVGRRTGPFVPPDDSEFRKALDYRCH